MKYDNLWEIPSDNEELNPTDNIYEIMKQQAQYLKTNTNGKVFGKFAKIKKINPLSTMGAVLTAISTREVLQNEDSTSLADANELYNDQKYGFEIYNNAYKFRILEMVISPVYPVHMIIDEGITQNIEDDILSCSTRGKTTNHYMIDSDDQLISCLRLIFSSKKVKYLLYKLQQQAETKDD